MTTVKGNNLTREYPQILKDLPQPKKSISFICVKFSDEFKFNINTSECVHNELNEFIVIDNTGNIFYPTLGQAINAGIEKANYDLLVIVHEDVVLLPNWQSMFEQSLNALEDKDPDWSVAGVTGWNENEEVLGHLSDPRSYRNTLLEAPFAEVNRIDEQVLILRKSKGLFLDPELPSIHHIGRDLPCSAAHLGLRSYVLNAPSIHKYADAEGNRINTARDSSKIVLREGLAYLADKACSDEYIINKWPDLDASFLKTVHPGQWSHAQPPKISKLSQLANEHRGILEQPIILLAKGGGGSRLLSILASDIDLFIGSDINPTGDSREMARSIYRGIIRKFRCANKKQASSIVPDLQATATEMLENSNWPEKWGFKLPESLFILAELKEAFPNAKYVFFCRDPLSTVLRRSHMTARFDNQLGQISLQQAYAEMNIPATRILTDDDAIRMAITTVHQHKLVMKFKRQIPDKNWLDLRFENLLGDAEESLHCLANFCGLEVISNKIVGSIDTDRTRPRSNDFTEDSVALVRQILGPIRSTLGYSKNV